MYKLIIKTGIVFMAGLSGILGYPSHASLVECLVEGARNFSKNPVRPQEFPDFTLAEVIKLVGETKTISTAGLHATIHSSTYKGDYYMACFFASDQIKKDGDAFKMISVPSLHSLLSSEKYKEDRKRSFERSLSTQRLMVQCKTRDKENDETQLIYKTCLHYSLIFKGTSQAQLDQKFEFLLFRNRVNANTKIIGFANIKNFLPYLS